MPELPEVETVRRALEPVMTGARFSVVRQNRPDLRFPLPKKFQSRLVGTSVEMLDRRGKYLIAGLSSGESLIMHLGMSGRFTIHTKGKRQPGEFVHAHETNPIHDHVVFEMAGKVPATIVYNDPRRFGFMDVTATETLDNCRHFAGMGPEPLGNSFSAITLREALLGRKTPIKLALLDQKIVAGLGNIYVCEALYRARVSPRRAAYTIGANRSDRIYRAIIEVLREAIEAGGSSLKDFANAEGGLGYFQHRFDVYGKEGEACERCSKPVKRLVQGGRSTFFCSYCQR